MVILQGWSRPTAVLWRAPGIDDRDVGALGGQLLEPAVQLPDGQGAGVYSNQVMTSFC